MKVYCFVDSYNLKTQFGEYNLGYGINDIPDKQIDVQSEPYKLVAPALNPIVISTPGGIIKSGSYLYCPDVSDINRYRIMGLALNGCTITFDTSTGYKVYSFRCDNLKLAKNYMRATNSAHNADSQDILAIEIHPGFLGASAVTLIVGSNIPANPNNLSVMFH